MAKNDHLVQDKNEKEATCSGAPSETSSAESRAYTPIRACQDFAQLCCLMAKNNRVAQDNANRNARAMALQETQGKRNLRVQTITELAKILHNDAGLMAKIDFVAQENADIPPYVKRLFKRGKGCGNLRAKALNTLELATVLHKNAGLMGKKDLMVQGNANMKASKIALEAKQVMLNLRAQISYSNCKMFHRDAGLMVMKDLVVPRIRSGGKSSLKCN